MPTVYRFRVSFEDHDDVYRDIEIRSNQHFEDLHLIIQSAINFDATKPASFFMSNDYWVRGQEISSAPRIDREGKQCPLMSESRLNEFIVDPHQKIMYLTDYDANWNLLIELIKLLPSADEKRNYPVCVKTHGDAPRQYNIIAAPKVAATPEDELAALLLADGLLLAVDEVADEEEDPLSIKEDMMEEAEDGVELEEIEGMSEEGEEEVEKEEEENNEEMDFQDSDDEREDQF